MKSSILLLLAALLVAGCGRTTTSHDTLVYSRGTDADSLDPLDTSLGESVKVITNIYETLVTYDERTVELVPGLAHRWETSDDQLEWTFYLRDGVVFHDGTPLDAEAVVFNFRRMLEDEHPHRYGARRPYLPNFEMIESVKAASKLSVRMRLEEPSAVLLNNLAMFPASIVSPTAIEKYRRAISEHPVGTGPFQFDSWQRDQRIVLRAFEDYWNKKAGLQRVVFIPVAENAIRAQQLIRGEAHLTDDLPPAEMDALQKHPQIVVQQESGLNVGYLAMQMEKPPLHNRKLREAIWHALDRQRLIAVAYQGHAQVAVTIVPPNMWGHHGGLSDRPYDPARARQLLQEAAAEEGFDLPLRLDLYFMKQPRPYMQQPRQVAVFVRDALADIGIQVDLIANDYRQHFQRLSAGEHQLGLAGWVSDNADPDNFLFTLLDKSNINDQGGNNLSRYANEEVHQLLIQAQVELDQQKREQLYQQAQEIIFEDAPVVPLIHMDLQVAHRRELMGYHLHPTFLVRLGGASLRSEGR